MAENNIEYLLGIDGGGTKTEFLLTDLNKNEINRVVLGTSNPINIGIKNSKSILTQGIYQTCEGLNYEKISVFAGLAGGNSKNVKSEIHRFLNGFGFGAYANGSDTDSTLKAALKGKNGVAVIMGTGIIALAILDKKTHRTGGWGYMIDKGGSGFCLGSDALNAAFEFLDGRGGSELIYSLVKEHTDKPLADSITDIYSGGAAYVASFAPIIFEAYKKGDKVAESILDRNVCEAAKTIKRGYEFSKNKVVICGGLCRQKEILKQFLIKYLGEDFPLEFMNGTAVEGAITLAESNIRK
ncbi:MAG: hypothetical protein IJN85_06110 [Oscillospiraceae bacterium]|nr:hypothetical protein [Oscillospiraceae bacterium]